jgi:hypothetical protein
MSDGTRRTREDGDGARALAAVCCSPGLSQSCGPPKPRGGGSCGPPKKDAPGQETGCCGPRADTAVRESSCCGPAKKDEGQAKGVPALEDLADIDLNEWVGESTVGSGVGCCVPRHMADRRQARSTCLPSSPEHASVGRPWVIYGAAVWGNMDRGGRPRRLVALLLEAISTIGSIALVDIHLVDDRVPAQQAGLPLDAFDDERAAWLRDCFSCR